MSDSNLSTLISRRNTKRGKNPSIYDGCLEALTRLGNHSLGKHDFNITFGRRTDEKNNEFSDYVNLSNNKSFSAHLIAEIGSASEGTWMAAYNNKLPAYKLPLTDESSAQRMVIAARCPTGAPPKLVEAFHDFLAAVDGVRGADADQEERNDENFHVTEWASRSDGAPDQPCDTMLLRLGPTYEAPKLRTKSQGPESSPAKARPRNQKASAAAADVDMNDGEKEDRKVERKVGDTYHPDCLPDHRGPFFSHETSRLVQRDYRGLEGDLIAPDELYKELTEGTLFSAQITLHTYIFDAAPNQARNKIYHIYVERLRIMDRGYGAVWTPPIPTLPSSGSTTPKKRGRADRDDDVDTAFDAFNAVSPVKKGRK